MPRQPRCCRSLGSLEPGRLYHVTNRGVDRSDIFHSDLDRIVFLSMLAEACLRFGAVCHAWCLMTTHFHLVVEDTRGVLSQLVHRVESSYARYFNDTRPRRRSGPLFDSRFRSELVDSDVYFEQACAYVLLNPLETKVPLAASAEEYLWSSAALVCSDLTTAESVARLLGRVGSVDQILDALPRTSRPASRELRRARLEALASGDWLERDHLLAGRSSEQYRRALELRQQRKAARREGVAPPQPCADAKAASRREELCARPAFSGFALGDVVEEILAACERFVPTTSTASAERLGEAALYALHGFTSAPLSALARVVGITETAAERLIEHVRSRRVLDRAWQRLLWAVEWALRWRLGAAPYRC